MTPSTTGEAADDAHANVLTHIAALDLDCADGWAGLRQGLLEIERLSPGALARLRADIQVRRLRRHNPPMAEA